MIFFRIHSSTSNTETTADKSRTRKRRTKLKQCSCRRQKKLKISVRRGPSFLSPLCLNIYKRLSIPTRDSNDSAHKGPSKIEHVKTRTVIMEGTTMGRWRAVESPEVNLIGMWPPRGWVFSAAIVSVKNGRSTVVFPIEAVWLLLCQCLNGYSGFIDDSLMPGLFELYNIGFCVIRFFVLIAELSGV